MPTARCGIPCGQRGPTIFARTSLLGPLALVLTLACSSSSTPGPASPQDAGASSSGEGGGGGATCSPGVAADTAACVQRGGGCTVTVTPASGSGSGPVICTSVCDPLNAASCPTGAACVARPGVGEGKGVCYQSCPATACPSPLECQNNVCN